MKNLTCIVCPNGCHLQVEEVDGQLIVHGNRCPRGEAFGKQEMISPMRTITSTVRTVFPDVPVVPVRVSGEIPKDRFFDVMHEINRVRLDQRLTTAWRNSTALTLKRRRKWIAVWHPSVRRQDRKMMMRR